jgi:hypothetical protein
MITKSSWAFCKNAMRINRGLKSKITTAPAVGSVVVNSFLRFTTTGSTNMDKEGDITVVNFDFVP